MGALRKEAMTREQLAMKPNVAIIIIIINAQTVRLDTTQEDP